MHGAVPQLHDYIIDAARRLPDKDAVVCRGERLTFGEIDARSNAVANTLVAAGVERGDRVIVYADNTFETVISFWGVLKANACLSIVNPLTKEDKLAYLLNDCRATAMITDAHLGKVFEPAIPRSEHLKAVIVSGKFPADKVEALPGGMTWDKALEGNRDAAPARVNHETDLAAIIYTSGSTGDPKGVMLTHRNMLTAATSVSTYLEYAEEDVVLAVLPLAFDYGMYQMIMSTKVGARILLERSFAFPAKVLKTMVEEKVTVFPGVPTIFAILANLKNLGDYDLGSLESVTNTAAALSVKHITMLREMFPQARVFSMYGLTECKRCTYLPPELIDTKPDCVGIAIPNTEMWLVDDQDNKVGPNTVGQLVIRGATVMNGYWEKPESTAKKLRPGPIPGEKVLYTGDYCKMDEDGHLYFVGRMDNVIKSRGEKVAPKEVETVLHNLAEVKEAAVIGVDDEILGQAVKAFVVLEEGVDVNAKWIQRECQKRLENFMVPKHVEFRDVLPKGQTGKIQKTELK
jgi:amino acid adenylation domain-containing protein